MRLLRLQASRRENNAAATQAGALQEVESGTPYRPSLLGAARGTAASGASRTGARPRANSKNAKNSADGKQGRQLLIFLDQKREGDNQVIFEKKYFSYSKRKMDGGRSSSSTAVEPETAVVPEGRPERRNSVISRNRVNRIGGGMMRGSAANQRVLATTESLDILTTKFVVNIRLGRIDYCVWSDDLSIRLHDYQQDDEWMSQDA